MKLPIALAVSILCLATSLRADWVIVQHSIAMGKQQDMVIKIKGDLIRNDIGDTMSAIIDDKGSMQLFNHKDKTVMKIDPEVVKSVSAMVGKMMGGGGNAKPVKPKATGEMVKVGEWDTEVYTWEGKIGVGKYYVAKGFPKFEELTTAMDKAIQAMGDPMAALFPSNKDFLGMVVKSEMTKMGQVATTELVSAKEEALDIKAFEAPSGYKEKKLPLLPGGLGK